MTNRQFMKDEIFSTACEMAGVKVTKRQASKFRNEKGSAFGKLEEATRQVEEEKAEEEATKPDEFTAMFREALGAAEIEPDMVQS